MAERDLVTISRIQDIKPIPGYDRVEQATVENYNVIVQKGEYKPGDLCVYVSYDVVIKPTPETEFLRKSSWSPKYQGYRIKEIRLCSIFSSGIILPLSTLPDNYIPKEGDEVSEFYGAVKYDPQALAEQKQINMKKDKYPWLIRKLLRFKFMQRIIFGKTVAKVPYPNTVPKSSETNIQKIFNSLKETGHKFIVTEKLEGSSSCYCLVPRKGRKPEFRLYSHNVMRFKGDKSIWDQINTKYDIEKKLRDYYKETGVCLAIEGEVLGPSIQANIYGLEELELRLFRMFDVKTGYIYKHSMIHQIADVLEIPYVPVLDWSYELPDTLEEVLLYSEGKSVLADVEREGVIITSVKDPLIRAKIKGVKYKEWFAERDPNV